MHKALKLIITIAVMLVCIIVSDKLYNRVLEKKTKRLRFHIMLQSGIVMLLYMGAVILITACLPEHMEEQVLDEGMKTFRWLFLYEVAHFVHYKKDLATKALGVIIKPFEQVQDREDKMLESKVKEEEVYRLQEHIKYILGHLKEEAVSIRENEIKLWIGKDKTGYYIKLKYSWWGTGAEDEVFELGKAEFKKCIEHLSCSYHISNESEDYEEVTKLYVNA